MAIEVTRAAVVVVVSMITACAQSTTRPAMDSYTLLIADNAEQRRFDLTLISNDARALCVPIESWPSRSGLFPTATDAATLTSETDVLPVRSELFSAYCPGGCGQHRIEPNSDLRGHIAYEAFGDPVRLAADTGKKLRFSVSPNYCKK